MEESNMKFYETPQIKFISFNSESILTLSDKVSSEKIVTQELEQNGTSAIKSVSWDEMW